MPVASSWPPWACTGIHESSVIPARTAATIWYGRRAMCAMCIVRPPLINAKKRMRSAQALGGRGMTWRVTRAAMMPASIRRQCSGTVRRRADRSRPPANSCLNLFEDQTARRCPASCAFTARVSAERCSVLTVENSCTAAGHSYCGSRRFAGRNLGPACVIRVVQFLIHR
jgi:hypothetical protein